VTGLEIEYYDGRWVPVLSFQPVQTPNGIMACAVIILNGKCFSMAAEGQKIRSRPFDWDSYTEKK
jgi:hypothetical protein